MSAVDYTSTLPACPRDGQPLSDHHREQTGWECPVCRRVWQAWEVHDV